MAEFHYSTWEGRSKADVKHCLKCRWHSVASVYVICEYTLMDYHGIRGCRAGVGCDKFEPGEGIGMELRRQAVVTANRGRADSFPYSREWHIFLRDTIGIKEIHKKTGISRSYLYLCASKGRIGKGTAKRIYDHYGIDVTGGKLQHG